MLTLLEELDFFHNILPFLRRERKRERERERERGREREREMSKSEGSQREISQNENKSKGHKQLPHSTDTKCNDSTSLYR